MQDVTFAQNQPRSMPMVRLRVFQSESVELRCETEFTSPLSLFGRLANAVAELSEKKVSREELIPDPDVPLAPCESLSRDSSSPSWELGTQHPEAQ